MGVMKYLEQRATMVEKEIDRWAPQKLEPESLANAARHLINAGGKRIRPAIVLTACEAVGGKPDDAIEAAAALELLHNFTLIHDDIMDRDEFRRNVKTVHMIWGEPIAIVAGDALFAKVFEAIAANASKLKLDGARTADLFKVVSKASFEVCQGQALDMLFENKKDVSEDEYMRMVGWKTGVLIEASARVGGLLGNGDLDQVEALANYGRMIGVAFQIRDDVLGISGKQKKFGKPIGSDIREGKRTLIVVKALETMDAKDTKILLGALGKHEAPSEEIKAAIGVLEKSGAIDYANGVAQKLVLGAKSKLKVLPKSEAKEILLALADFVVGREL